MKRFTAEEYDFRRPKDIAPFRNSHQQAERSRGTRVGHVPPS